jgi:hypothetical protein
MSFFAICTAVLAIPQFGSWGFRPKQYQQQPNGFANGELIAGWPRVSGTFEQCKNDCDTYSDLCVGFTFAQQSQQCFIFSRILSWRTDGLCGPDGRSLCQGFAVFEDLSFPNRLVDLSSFNREFNPFPSGADIGGFPQYGITFKRCAESCTLNVNCGGFVYKRPNPVLSEDQSFCTIKQLNQINGWNLDGLCGADSRSLCIGYSRLGSGTNPGGFPGGGFGNVDPNVFERQLEPFGDGGTLPGYPVYNQVFSSAECAQRCQAAPECAGFTFKARNTLPNDQTICWLKFGPGLTFRGDGLCGPDNRQFCQGYKKRFF